MKAVRLKKYVDMLSTLWIILSTGSLVFCIFNMKMSMFVLLGIGLLNLVFVSKLDQRMMFSALGIIVFLAVNAALNLGYFNPTDDILILFIRVFSLMLIFSSITKRQFMDYFCKILLVLCLLSLVCFGVSELGITLPFEKEVWFKNKFYIYSFYHVVGRWYKFHRNAGIFWESPAFAIFINIACLFLMVGITDIPQKRKGFYFIVYSITLLTTKATTAYLAYIFVIAAVLVNQKHNRKEKKANFSKMQKYGIIAAVILMAIVLIIVEMKTHIIQRKLINNEGSYNTRENDTLSTLAIMLQRPLTGYGMFNNYTHEALLERGVTDNSNCFTAMIMYFGIPMATMYYLYFAYRLRKLFDCSILCYLCIGMVFFVTLNTEMINVMTLFIAFLFPWKEDKVKRQSGFHSWRNNGTRIRIEQ